MYGRGANAPCIHYWHSYWHIKMTLTASGWLSSTVVPAKGANGTPVGDFNRKVARPTLP